MSDTDGLAAETRQLLDAATELTAEWYIERTYNKRVPDHWSVDVLSDDDHVCSVRGGDEGAHALAALIAAAPRLLAGLLDQLHEAWMERSDAEAERDRLAAESRALREALGILAEATTITDAVPDVRRFAQHALAAADRGVTDGEAT